MIASHHQDENGGSDLPYKFANLSTLPVLDLKYFFTAS